MSCKGTEPAQPGTLIRQGMRRVGACNAFDTPGHIGIADCRFAIADFIATQRYSIAAMLSNKFTCKKTEKKVT